MKRLPIFLLIMILSPALFSQKDQKNTPQWRPLYHFTPLKNWTNDPNGLVYLNGVYELYNQQNPYENKWGHMSWGHATTTDLVHWKHYPIAMPEAITNNGKDTTWRFSGSAVYDKNNTSGFCKTGGCIVVIYTAHQPNIHKESQFVAYSNDGGMHFIQYTGNPVIDLQKRNFRDPNVSWNKQINKWLMVVALPTENKVRFYSSPNLREWTLLSEFGSAGLKKGIWECPSFFQLPVEGEPGKFKSVLMTSFGGSRGPRMQYFTGDFDGKTFTNDNPPDTALLVDNGSSFYAAIPWNNLPAGQKIYIGWMVPPQQETFPWRGQMSIPRDLILRRTKNGIRLYQEPASIIQRKLTSLSDNHVIELRNIKVNKKEEDIFKGKDVKGNSYWLKAELDVPGKAMAGFEIAQKKDESGKITSETIIGYDASKQQLFVDRTNSGEGKIDQHKLIQTADVINADGKITLEILFDKSSLEVFINNGEKVITTYVYPDQDADLISAFSLGGTSLIKNLKFWNLSKIKK